jgi:hypothetical protein
MHRRTIALSALLSAVWLAPTLGCAEEKSQAPTAAQVQQLQDELAAMKTEMDGLRAELQRQNAPAHGPMMGHMGAMQRHWQMMHDQSCGMHPQGCPGYTPPKQ